MFRTAVQIIGVAAAGPVVGLLCTMVYLAMRTYRFTRLRLLLLRVVHDDLVLILKYRAYLEEHERDDAARALKAIRSVLRTADVPSLAKDEANAERLALILLADVHDRNVLVGIPGQRGKAFARCIENLSGKVSRSSPRVVARLYGFWIALEQVRLAAHAFRQVGMPTSGLILRRAGEDVTAGTTIGLVVSILVWLVGSRYQGDFYNYIGGGATLGAFLGLARTASSFTRKVTSVTWGGASRGQRITAVVVPVITMAAMQLVLFAGWWPPTPR